MGKTHRPKILQELDIKKTIHPKSRKAKNLSKKLTRDAKITKKKAFTNMKLQVLGEKLSWFKENFDTSLNCYSLEELEELIQKYIDRNIEELEHINRKQIIRNRKTQQHASRENLIRICRENEMAEFLNSGFETIDLTSKENFEAFKSWNGELRFISNLKLKKFIKSQKKSTKTNEETTSTTKDEQMHVDDPGNINL